MGGKVHKIRDRRDPMNGINFTGHLVSILIFHMHVMIILGYFQKISQDLVLKVIDFKLKMRI